MFPRISLPGYQWDLQAFPQIPFLGNSQKFENLAEELKGISAPKRSFPLTEALACRSGANGGTGRGKRKGAEDSQKSAGAPIGAKKSTNER
jgi:hypothetical protein